MKKRIKYLIAWAIAIVLLALFAKKVKNDAKAGKFILSIYFHSPSKALFEFCIKWLIKNDFRFLSQDDILSISQMKEPIPRAAVLITVDDGWLTNEKNIVEIANQYKVPVTIFVTTEAIQEGNFWWPYIKKASEINLGFPAVEPLKKLPNRERISILKKVKESIAVDREAMTVDQIKKIAKSNFITIGGHTATHPILINCDNEEAYRELKESKEIAEMWISKNIIAFAYPNGDYGDREMGYLKDLNYSLAYTTKPFYLTQSRLENIYELPRFCIFENISKQEAICRMLGIWQKII